MERVWITGAGTGLGRALAHRYAGEGNHVILTGRNKEKLMQVHEEIMEYPGTSEIVVCDISDADSVVDAVRQVDHADVLINNAGVGIFGELQNYTPEQIDLVLDTNVKGTILLTQHTASMLKKSEGRVLNIISTAGLRGKRNESIYCASKYAVRGFTESLHQEWEGLPMTATAVYMGGMNTPFWDQSDHVENPGRMKGPEVVAEQIFQEDDGRKEIFVDR
ncbi:UNVERIFIED_CONTAM: SDR family NAD(P)-dependent oxidoreductase [Halobacillus marinus]|uniref:SDR family NAD(P)-dependent oxidoreductase n=1 Tax=Halobacillus sp. BAB-2008 TaxID=1246484 RepID=UPI0002A4EC41|nr:SDR family oxidoreductase [Halobacillus sp. BAB-2008]ELK48818.1 short-chain dehydrogenase/reductase family protein [Halobacillus sp. BAB-2008]